MTPYQLDESANAPCTRTMVGLVDCAVAAAPLSKRPTDARIAAKIFISSFLFLPSAKHRVMRAVVRSRRPDCDFARQDRKYFGRVDTGIDRPNGENFCGWRRCRHGPCVS